MAGLSALSRLRERQRIFILTAFRFIFHIFIHINCFYIVTLEVRFRAGMESKSFHIKLLVQLFFQTLQLAGPLLALGESNMKKQTIYNVASIW